MPRGREPVVLPVDVADEVLALVDDVPGEADEELLDAARTALTHPGQPSPTQHEAIEKGGALAVGLPDDLREQLIAVIDEEPVPIKDRKLSRARSKIAGKLSRANKRRQDRRRQRRGGRR